ncbi:MAG TPA: hypothetical protein VF230_16255 [Acidimicrobiales bacterium]
MASSKVKITSKCAPPPADGQILFPSGSPTPAGRRVLIEGNHTSKLMKAGMRSDGGNAACLLGGALAGFGGEGAEIDYRTVGFLGVVSRDRWLALQFLVSLLTTLGALITAWQSYITDSAADGSFANDTAVAALVIAAVIAIVKFIKEYREL